MPEPLVPARCCRGNTRRSGSWAEEGSLDPSLQERRDRDAPPSAKFSSRETIAEKDCEEERGRAAEPDLDQNITALFLTTVASEERRTDLSR